MDWLWIYILDNKLKYFILFYFTFWGVIHSACLHAGDTTSWFKVHVDTSYIEDLSHDLTIRAYTSRKYSTYGIMDFRLEEKLQYNPNSRLILGLGFSYGVISINVGVSFPALNNQDSERDTLAVRGCEVPSSPFNSNLTTTSDILCMSAGIIP